jgi:prepilin peptidase CpaA
MNPLSELPLALACGVTLVAAWLDAKTGRIPNLLTLPLLPMGLALGALDSGLPGLGSAALGALFCVAVPYALFRASRGVAIGGGDVKLFAGLGALLGPLAGLRIEFASLLVLCVCALVTLAWRGELLASLKRSTQLAFQWFAPHGFPFRRAGSARAAQQRPIPLDGLLTMRLGPAICFVTWSLALLQHLPARFIL